MGSEGTSSDTPKANYYNNDETTYGWDGRKCGLLYNWPAVHYLDENSDVMLPDGWRVATKDDFQYLSELVSAEPLKLNVNHLSWAPTWEGTNELGFSSLPAGTAITNYSLIGTTCTYWTSEQIETDNAYQVQYRSDNTYYSVIRIESQLLNRKCSVRLVRDYPPPVIIGGRSYKTVKMPDGKVWLAENLDWKFTGLIFRDGTTGNEVTADATIAQGAYYNYDESTYGASGNKYGMLYNWTAADYINKHLSELKIPAGWHVATSDDYDLLLNTCGENPGTKLKSTTGWPSGGEGTDYYGFNAKLSGEWSNGWYMNSTSLWSSNEPTSGASAAYNYHLSENSSDVGGGYGDKYRLMSLRLVKNLN